MTKREGRIMVLYRVMASFERDGQLLDCSDGMTLGDAAGVLYATEEEARAAADDLQDSLDETDLDPSTSYSVVEDRHAYQICVRAIQSIAEQDRGGEPESDSYSRTEDAEASIREWYSAAGEAGDLDLVRTINLLGVRGAARIYKAARGH